MRRLVEAPLLVRVAEAPRDLEPELPLRVDVELAVQERVVHVTRVGDLANERDELLLEAVEDLAHLGGLHVRLVVVEQHVVRLVRLVEALDVAVPELEVGLEVRSQELEVGLLLRRAPGRQRQLPRPSASRRRAPAARVSPFRSRGG